MKPRYALNFYLDEEQNKELRALTERLGLTFKQVMLKGLEAYKAEEKKSEL